MMRLASTGFTGYQLYAPAPARGGRGRTGPGRSARLLRRVRVTPTMVGVQCAMARPRCGG